MTTVILLALASTTCAAISTVLKHMSANKPVHPFSGGRLPQTIERMIANPIFLLALGADALAVVFQVFALRYGDLSTVQPVLTLALVISLGLDHLASRTRLSQGDVIWAGTLVAGLVLFLVSSGATHPEGGLSAGRRTPGMILAGTAAVGWTIALIVSRRATKKTVHVRTLAVGVAAIYATTAALIKASTRIADQAGLRELATSWQLWTLIVAAIVGLVLNQHVFSMAPLHVSLPVIASLDPLFSVIIGRAVFDEKLLATPSAVILEVLGLTLLLVAVVHLSRSKVTVDDHRSRGSDSEPA